MSFEQQLKDLNKALTELHEIEKIATETNTHLKKQGEQLQKNKESIKKLNEELNISSRIIQKLKSWWRG